MKKDDIEFLRELQHELNTQETDFQAEPRYWGIAETKDIPVPDGCGEPYIYVPEEGTLTEKEFIEYLLDNDYIDTEELSDIWSEVDKDSIVDLVDFANDELDMEDVRIVDMEKKTVINNMAGCFLTKRACKKHIEQNSYHYSNPRTYAMTAWRNPEFERLISIISNLDIEKDLKETDN